MRTRKEGKKREEGKKRRSLRSIHLGCKHTWVQVQKGKQDIPIEDVQKEEEREKEGKRKREKEKERERRREKEKERRREKGEKDVGKVEGKSERRTSTD